MINITEKVPEFPKFRSFSIDDVDWYYAYYLEKKINPYVDIHPENLFVWLNFNNDLTISRLDDCIIIKYTNVLDKNKKNIIPLSNLLKDSTIERIMAYLKAHNLPLEIHEVPSKTCSALSPNKWVMENDRDSYEYILDTKQQLLLEGGDFTAHRRCVHTFEKEHSNDLVEIKYYKEFNEEIKDIFYRHINSMPFNHSEKMSQQNLAEPIIIRKNLDYALTFHKKVLLIKINGETASVAMVSYLDKNTAAINHLKVDYSIQDIFKYTNYQLAKILIDDNIKEINIEQDLGIEGMRMFKENMKPSRFLEKKIIRPRPQ
jgi:hypothetical protein